MVDAGADGTAARLLARIARRVGSSLELDETLAAVAEAVVEALGYGTAVVNLVAPDDELYVVAVAGCDRARAALDGTHASLESWRRLLAAATPIGALRFLRHDAERPDGTSDMHFFVPELPTPDEDPGRTWHPEDGLFAPLVDAAGELLGVLSVDEPSDGLLPSAERAAMLEAFAVQASLAIAHAREHADLARSEALLRQIFDESPIAKTLTDSSTRLLRVNRAFCEFLGRESDEVAGKSPLEFTHPDDREATRDAIESVRAATLPAVTLEKRYLHRDGHVVWGRLTLAQIAGSSEGLLLGAIEDITESRASAEQLRHLALHDSLTGLPNRTLVSDRIQQALARARRDGTCVGLAVIDIDHFKLVNDSYGHPAGDQLLVAMAAAVQTVLRDFDTAGRLGGDELIVVCEGIDGVDGMQDIAERLRGAARITVTINGTRLHASASVGYTVSRPDTEADELIAEADSALYRAKSAGRGRCEMFDEQMRRKSVALLELRSELTRALGCDELRLHYQPIVAAATGVPAGFEALIRWQHPVRGLLMPADFLDVLTDSDLEQAATRWVLERACGDLQRLQKVWGPRTAVSVNLSPRQLSRDHLATDVADILGSLGVDPSRLWLEVTEHEVLDLRHRQSLQALRDIGCKVALDDFGTGYCGLAYLQQLPVQGLKVDRGFVAKITTDPVSASITAAVNDLARLLGIVVVAEGVETADQVEALRAMGIPLLQGFHFARPQPVEVWLDAQNVGTPPAPQQRTASVEIPHAVTHAP